MEFYAYFLVLQCHWQRLTKCREYTTTWASMGGGGQTQIVVNRKPVRDFILVANNNPSRVSDRFRDTATQMSKI